MISKCASLLTDFLVNKDVIEHEEKDIYKYGFELIISLVVNLVCVLIIGAVIGEVFLALVAFLIFATVRTQCGGYHATTYVKCNFFLIIVFCAILFFSKYFQISFMNRIFFIMMYIYVPIFLSVFSPVSSIYNPIEAEEDINRIKKKVLLRTLIWEAVGIAAWFLGWKDITATVIITFGAVCILLVIEIERRKGNEKHS